MMIGEPLIHLPRDRGVAGWTAVLVIPAPHSASGQAPSSAIRGVVLGSGQPLRSARVRLVHKNSGQALTETVTDAEGRFQFAALLSGAYQVEVSADGWRDRKLPLELRRARTGAGAV